MTAIHNPQYDEVIASGFVGKDTWALFDKLTNHLLAGNYDPRTKSNVTYAFSIICPDVLALVSKYARSVIDYGAGTGYWGYLLTQLGIEYLGIDDYSWDGMAAIHGDGKHRLKVGKWHPVKRGGIGALKRAQTARQYDALLLAWPPYDRPMAVDALLAWSGRYVFYSGEAEGGCTGDDAFHALIAADYTEVESVQEFNWAGLHSEFIVYERTVKS
jgi:hypothetical protein